jgi:putative phosphoesterase
MKLLLISDIHANPWALDAVLRDAGPVDHVFCAGDLVNYGPAPREAVARVRGLDATIVQGNHDAAVALGTDPRASPKKQPLALATRDWTREQLSEDGMDWLSRLQQVARWTAGDTRFLICHATPQDKLYDYRLTPQADDDLVRELTAGVDADVLVLGHTHLPFVRQMGTLMLVNPGSVGQPLDGDPRASYALWEDRRLELRRVTYDQAPALAALARLPLAGDYAAALNGILRRGTLLTTGAS